MSGHRRIRADHIRVPPAGAPCVLTLNHGSSSLRFAIFESGPVLRRRLAGRIERIGTDGTALFVTGESGKADGPRRLPVSDRAAVVAYLLRWLEVQPSFGSVVAVGHRVVHGLSRSAPARVTARLLAELRRITPYAPEHLPGEIALIAAVRRRHPQLPQVACFDTAFHRTMPRIARLLPIPRRYQSRGIERYGFHGLSYAYLLEELARLGDPAAGRGRVILAHLGNGASLAAVRDGRSIDTSMGFTPAAGLMMSTRSGDLDPGLLAFLARRDGMTPARFDRMVNHESGLLGVSGTSSDVRDLLARETRDPRAAEALALFCQQVKKGIGACAAVLGGLDTLVFAGGIGENAPLLRARICAGLGFLGIAIDGRRNGRGAAVISPSDGRVTVRIIPTDEEQMIARTVLRLPGLGRSGFRRRGAQP